MVVIYIIAILFIVLIVIVPLVEKFGPNMSQEEIRKYSRFILPAMAVLLVLQLIVFLVK